MEDVETRPVLAMLHNTAKDRWHPILFRFDPTPSGMSRHKSKNHHTEGFDNRADAEAFTRTEYAAFARKFFGVEPRLCLERDFSWDGGDIPAMVIFFSAEESPVPMLGT